jgi:hypothetical protein
VGKRCAAGPAAACTGATWERDHLAADALYLFEHRAALDEEEVEPGVSEGLHALGNLRGRAEEIGTQLARELRHRREVCEPCIAGGILHLGDARKQSGAVAAKGRACDTQGRWMRFQEPVERS